MNTKILGGSKKLWSLSFAFLLMTMMIFSLTVKTTPTAEASSPNTVFSNTNPITINTNQPVVGSLYPSTVNVSGMTGNTGVVTVNLFNVSHQRASDLDILLVSPTGQKFIIMSDALANPINNVNITLNTGGPSLPTFSSNFAGGTFTATNWVADADTFPAPAPAPPYSSPFQTGSSTFINTFGGASPNGTWSLYVVDDTAGLGGSIAGGWTLNVSSQGTPTTSFSNTASIDINDNQPQVATASPYPSTINVSGMMGVISNVKVTLNNITHPKSSDMDILLVTPNGVAFHLMSDSGFSANDVTLTLDDAASVNLPSSTTTLTSGVYKPTNNFDNDIGAIDIFPEPAPPPPYIQASFSVLGGFSPNGIWKLYVVDDANINSGSIAGGWSLDITTAPYVAPQLNCLSPVFAATANFSTGGSSNPTGLVSGDFNGDMKPDLVVTKPTTNQVAVMLGDGTGGFGAPASISTGGSNPYAVVAGQFNADTNLDIVVTNANSNTVSLLLGDGMGGFSAPAIFGVGSSPISVAVGDFNNDMNQDLAVANFGGFFAGTVSVLLGTGTGSFSPAINIPVRTQPSYIAVGNFNGDGNLDLAVANFGSNNLSILLGTGSGTFTAAPDVATGSGPVAIAVGDFNADGKSDLVVANYNSNTVQFYTGTGTGTFSNAIAVTSASGSIPISIAVADVNNDGNPDLAIAYRGTTQVRILFGGSGNFGQGSGIGSFTIGSAPNAIITADFNSDGEPDFATANTSSDNVSVLINSCAIAVGNRYDFEGDRKTDYAVYRPSSGSWFIAFSNGGTPQGRLLGNSTDKLVPADYNGDGITEIGYYRPSTGVWAIANWQFGSHQYYFYYIQFGIATDIPVPADYDGDGRADLCVYRPSDGVWYLRFSTDNSELAVPFGISEDKPVPADYDGDDKADIAVYRPSTGSWYILQSSNSQLRSEQFGISADRPVQADYDGDGKADLAVFRPNDGAWYIMQSSNNGFRAQFWGVGTDVPVPGDYDGDGKFDVAVWRPSIGYWFVMLSLTGEVRQVNWGQSGDIPIPSVYVP